MAAITRVDHVHVRRHMLGNQVGRARLAVAHHKDVGRHGTQGGDRVEQRFALGGRGAGNVQVDHVGREARGSDLEGGAGAGGVLEEQVEDASAAQQRHLLDLAVTHTHKTRGGIEHLGQDAGRKTFYGQQMQQFAVFVELGIALVQHATGLLFFLSVSQVADRSGCDAIATFTAPSPRETQTHPRRRAAAPAIGRAPRSRGPPQSRPGSAIRVHPGLPAPPVAHGPGDHSRTTR